MNDDELGVLLRESFGSALEAAYRTAASSSTIDRRKQPSGSKAKPTSSSSSTSTDVAQFVRQMSRLLEEEQQAEVESAENSLDAAAPSARDRVLPHLRLSDVETGLLGRSLLILVNNKGGGQLPLPPHRITPNDIVRLRPDKGPAGSASLCEGVVYRVRDDTLVIAVDDVPDNGLDVPLRLEKLANKVTYTRMNAALQALEEAATRGGSPIIDVCFGRTVPSSLTDQNNSNKFPIEWYNPLLDAAQRRGVDAGLQTNDITLIHGPPGTGKTTAVVELVLQEMARGGRVLVCAASNIAVDNLVERLAKHRGSLDRNWLIRAGHPARLLPQVLDHSLEARVLDSDSSALAKDCRREMRQLNQQLMRLQGKREEGATRRQLRRELKALAKEERKRQEGAVVEVLRSARVLCCTLTGLDGRQLSKALSQTNSSEGTLFDLVIIDEAAQALEPACWAALLRGRRAVLVGDHLQLPPTITSQRAAEGGLARTLFERLQMMYGGEKISTMLTVQYRMHRDIMEWASEAMYQGKLEAAPSVAEHTLEDLKKSDDKNGDAPPNGDEEPDDDDSILAKAAASSTRGSGQSQRNKSRQKKKGARTNNRNQSIAVATASPNNLSDASRRLLRTVLLFIDTAGCDAVEQQDEESASLYNEREAAVVLAHAGRLVSAGVKPGDIGIITPYAAQAALLRQSRPAAWAPLLEVSTVDGFQGREKEAIIISCVRSSDSGGVGFLADARRMNVAVTRARRHCALVGDSETLGRDEFLKVLVSHFEQRGEYESAAELLDDHEAIV